MITDHCNNISSTSTIIKIQCDNVQNHFEDTGQIKYNSVAGNQKNDLNPVKINHSNHINIKTTKNNNNRTTMSCSPKNDNDNDQNDQSSSNSSSSVATTTTNNTAATKNTTVTNGGSSETNNGSSSNSNSNGSNRSLKSLIKKKIDPNQDFIKSHNKRVKFSETMQVFCYEEPDNQMPQIIALKPDINLMEFQTYMYDPPAEYQDLLTFEPPPDYRDFIANSLNVFRNEVTFDFIDDDEDSENFDDNRENRNPADYADIKSSFINPNDAQRNSKWQSMILNNNLDSLEEEQIIGVLKEDDILQAIGSQVTLPVNSNESNIVVGIDRSSVVDEHEFQVIDGGHNYDENLSSADFPVHHLNSYFLNTSSHLDDDDEEACCIDSSPNGSLQDLASDSSITSQDTIILINQNKAFHLESVSHPNDDSNNSININENIYENLQPCNNGGRDINNIVTQMVNGSNPTTISQHNPLDNKNITAMEKSPTINDQVSNNSVQEALYENTGELMLSSSNVIVAGATSSAMVSSASTIVGPSSCSSSSSTSSASSAASLVANHVKSFENRLSTSSSEDSRASGSDNENNNPKQSTINNSLQNNNNNVQFKQNILFYEKMMEQQQNNNNKQNVCKTIIANDQHHLNHQQQNDGMVTVNMQVNVPPPPPPPPSLMATGSQKYLVSSNGTMMPLPCYAILDTSRTSSSSSSSLSSTSSTSSLLVQQPQPTLPSSSSASLSSAAQTSSSQSSSTSTFPPLLVTNSVNLQTLAPTTVSSQIKSQGSPQNSNSPVSSISSSTSSSNQPNSNSIMNSEFLSPINQLNNPQQMSVLRKAVQQVNVTIPADKCISGNSNGGGTPSPNNDTTYSNISGPQQQLHGNVPRILTGPHPHLQQQHICIVNNVANNPDGNASQPHQHPPQHQSQLRPGQIVYRYPYALIQPTGMNGVSTIRPLQYIVQATPNNGAGPGRVNLNSNPSGQTLNPQSIIYNPKMMVGNQIGGYAISSMPNGSGGSNSSSPSSSSSTTTPSNIPNGNNAIKPGTIIQPAQIVVPNSNETSPNSTNAIPVGRILVQPSGAVLAPRIMQLHHPQHQKHPPPPYQCYVAGQQQQQQRLRQPMVMAYQQHPTNVPIRQTVRCAQYPINNNDLHSQHTEFPHPSEIRRRDGLYAYPQVLIRKDVETNCSSQPSSSSSLNNNNPKLNNDKQTITINTSTDQSTNETDKDELEAFVQQEHQRTERIKKRYSFTEDDDPTFGFARRPSVRGIRPKFGTTNEIIQQITSTMATTKTTNAQQHNQQVRHQLSNHQQQPQQHHPHLICGTLPKNLHHQQSHLQQQQFIQINHPPNNPQILSIVKQIGDMHVGGGGGKNVIVGSPPPPPPPQQSSAQMHPQLNKSQTLPRQIQHKIIVPKTNNGDAQPNTNNTSNNGNSTTQHEIVRIIDASMLNGPNSGPATASTVTLSRDQLKLHLQRQQAAAVAAQQQQQQQQQQQHQKILVAQRGINSGGGVVPNHQPSHDTTASTATFSPNHPVTINNNHHHSNNNNNNNNVNNNKSTVSVTTNIKDSTSKPILVTNNNNNNNENQKDVVYYSLNV